MKMWPYILECLAASAVLAQAGSENPFRVLVINKVTRAPIAGANVVLNGPNDDQPWGRTDAGGVFTGQTHSAGGHLLTVTRKGYRMTSSGMGKMVEVKSGTRTEATVEMQPLGVLAGRVLDQYGDPVRHAIIHTEDKMSIPGNDEDYESYSASITDDLGEYRIPEVEPGKHYVAVEYNSASDERERGMRSRYHWPQTGGLTVYPDATTMEQAQQVEVAAGGTVRLNDIRLNIQRAVTIRGRVKPPASQGRQQLSLSRTLGLALHSSPMVQGATVEADGSSKLMFCREDTF